MKTAKKKDPAGAKLRRTLLFAIPAVVLLLAAALLFFLLPREEKPEPIELSDFSSYKIVYPEEPGPALLTAARDLLAAIEAETGVTLEMSDDFVMPDWENGGAKVVPTDTLEILVGVTNRAESTTKKLGRDDWGVYFENNRLVISGGSEEAIALGVSHFCENYLMNGKVYYPSLPVIERAEYPYGSATLLGVDIHDWSIVRDNDNAFLAELIQREIADATGAVLPIRLVKDTPTDHEILVGIFTRDDARKTPTTDATKWYVAPLGTTRLSVRGGGLDGTYAAVMALRELFAGEGASLTLTFSEAMTGTVSDLSLYKLNLPEKLGSMAGKYDVAYSTDTVLDRFLAAKAELPEEVTVIDPISTDDYTLSRERVLYVSPSGNDEAAGTQEAPLATLGEALDRMGTGGGIIFLMDGVFSVTDTVKLTEKNSGARQAPLFIKAMEGASPTLTSNKALSTAADKWHAVDVETLGESVYERIPEEVRGRIVYTTLAEQGWRAEDVPKITTAAGPPSLFVGTSEYHLARFPNKDSGDLLHFTKSYDTGTVTNRDGSELYFEWEKRVYASGGALDIKDTIGWEIRVQNAEDGDENPEFGEEITSWVNTGNIWFYGSTFAGWEFGYYQLAYNTENTFWAHNADGERYDPIRDYGSQPYLGYPQYDGYYSLKSVQYNGWGCRSAYNTYFLFNALEALDAPGEWFYDERSGIIFLCPNEEEMELSDFTATCSNPKEFSILSMTGVHNVVLDGLTFNGSSNHGVEMNASGNVVVQNCRFVNARRHDLTMSECMNTAVIYSDFAGSGSAMLNVVNSASALALTPTNNVIQNNIFHDPKLSQHVALGWGGCRLVVSHNYFVNTTTTGTAGVECILEYNRFEGGSYDVEDGGMIYASGAASRGNHYRNNLFHMFNVTHQAVYNDTMGSGNYMYYNVVSTLHSRTGSNRAWYSSTGWGNVCYGNVTILRNHAERLSPGKNPLVENAPPADSSGKRGDELNESDLFYYYFSDDNAASDKRAYLLVDMNGAPQRRAYKIEGDPDHVTLGEQPKVSQKEAGHWWTGIKEGDVSRYLTKTNLKNWRDRAPEYINMMYGTKMILEVWDAANKDSNDDVNYHIKYFYAPWYLTDKTYTFNAGKNKTIPVGTVVQIPEWQYLETVTEGGEEKIKLVTVKERTFTVGEEPFELRYEEIAAMERLRRASAYCVVTNNIIFGGSAEKQTENGVTVYVPRRHEIITDNGAANIGYTSTALKDNNFMSFLFADYAPGVRAKSEAGVTGTHFGFNYDLTDKLWEDIENELDPSHTLEPSAIDGVRAAAEKWDTAGPTGSIDYDEWFDAVYPDW